MSAEDTSAPLAHKVKIRACVTSTPFWQGRGRDRNRVCYVSGIPNSYAHLTGPARVDATIAPIVAHFNNAGIETTYSCSGRPCDHIKHPANLPGWVNAGILFSKPLPTSLAERLPEGIYLDNPALIKFRPSTPMELKKRWYALRKVLLRWWGMQEGY